MFARAGELAERGDEAYWRGDFAAARAFYEEGVAQGDGEAMVSLGEALQDGFEGKVDNAAAVRLFRMADEAGYWWGSYNLADALVCGCGVDKIDAPAAATLRTKAVRLAREAYEKTKSPDAAYLLAIAHEEGKGAVEDEDATAEYCRYMLRMDIAMPKCERLYAASTLGGAAAGIIFGEDDDDGEEDAVQAAKDIMMAGYWLGKFAKEGVNPEAMSDYADFCMDTGKAKRSRKYDRMAFGAFLERAEKGSVADMARAGEWLADGIGCTKDAALAEKWLRKAVDAGDAMAMVTLANVVRKGGNSAEAWGLLARALAAGEPEALWHMAVWAAFGYGGEKNDSVALKFLKKAADMGYKHAEDVLEEDDPVAALRDAAIDCGDADE